MRYVSMSGGRVIGGKLATEVSRQMQLAETKKREMDRAVRLFMAQMDGLAVAWEKNHPRPIKPEEAVFDWEERLNVYLSSMVCVVGRRLDNERGNYDLSRELKEREIIGHVGRSILTHHGLFLVLNGLGWGHNYTDLDS
jgi:hypothetical protein